jgi:MarR family transcriptional regulator, transcriptional regulator for hemolysin
MHDYELHKRLGYRVSRLSRIMQGRLERILGDHRITRLAWCALTGIGEEGVSTPSELAAYIGITRPATSRLLRDLEARGLVARTNGSADGRSVTVSLTEKGNAITREARVLVDEMNRHFKSKLEPEHLAQVLRGLEILSAGEDEELTHL